MVDFTTDSLIGRYSLPRGLLSSFTTNGFKKRNGFVEHLKATQGRQLLRSKLNIANVLALKKKHIGCAYYLAWYRHSVFCLINSPSLNSLFRLSTRPTAKHDRWNDPQLLSLRPRGHHEQAWRRGKQFPTSSVFFPPLSPFKNLNPQASELGLVQSGFVSWFWIFFLIFFLSVSMTFCRCHDQRGSTALSVSFRDSGLWRRLRWPSSFSASGQVIGVCPQPPAVLLVLHSLLLACLAIALPLLREMEREGKGVIERAWAHTEIGDENGLYFPGVKAEVVGGVVCLLRWNREIFQVVADALHGWGRLEELRSGDSIFVAAALRVVDFSWCAGSGRFWKTGCLKIWEVGSYRNIEQRFEVLVHTRNNC